MKLKTLVGILAASMALSAYAADAGQEASQAWQDTKEAAHNVADAGKEAAEAVGEKTKEVATSAAQGTKEAAETVGEKTKEVAESAAQGTKEAAETVGEKTKEAASSAAQGTKEASETVGEKTKEAASSAAQETKEAAATAGEKTKESEDKVSKWLDSATDKVKGWFSKGSETTQKYSDEIQKKLPEYKEQIKQGWKEGVEKSKETSKAVSKWMEENLSKERIAEAQQWMSDFKSGTQEKVIDPLVPHLLATRYPLAVDEWNDGYRRVYSVQVQGLDTPIDIKVPMSWSVVDNAGPNALMTWVSDAGQGDLSLSLIDTPQNATIETVITPLLLERPTTRTIMLPGTDIRRVTYVAEDDKQDAYYFYAIPTQGIVVQLTARVIRDKNEPTSEVNKRLDDNSEFFNLVAEGLNDK